MTTIAGIWIRKSIGKPVQIPMNQNGYRHGMKDTGVIGAQIARIRTGCTPAQVSPDESLWTERWTAGALPSLRVQW